MKVPALALTGEEDYVSPPQMADVWLVPGGHISPSESVGKTREAILKVISLAEPRKRRSRRKQIST